MEDIFDKIQAVTGISKYSGSEVITPKWVVTDMVDLLPQEVFNKDSRFLDPAVKSGRFLAEIYRRLMDSEQMVQAFPDQQVRRKHILDNQLYGFATSAVASTIIRKQLYDDPTKLGNIRFTGDKVTKEGIQGAFSIMKFDVVIGNPPYNNDIYLDFVHLGHSLASKYTCMITPAKWQAKGGEKNEKFRKDIVPYMSKVVYYPNCSDVFEINDCSGISYYLIDGEIHEKKEIRNVCKHNENLNSIEFRTLNLADRLLNVGNSLSKKLAQQPKLKFPSKIYRYCVYINTQVNPARGLENVYQALGMVSYSTGKAQILGKHFVVDRSKNENPSSGTRTLVFSSDSIHECESFLSYAYSKLVRLLIWSSISTLTIVNEETWRFVPDPGAFDHIFTDQELYQKYGLTQEEIKIIESVIKERR